MLLSFGFLYNYGLFKKVYGDIKDILLMKSVISKIPHYNILQFS